MPLFHVDIDLTAEHMAQLDALRGDVAREDFLLQCIQMGLIDFQEEANRVHRDFLNTWATNATEFFKGFRETRKLSVARKPVETTPTVGDKLHFPRKP